MILSIWPLGSRRDTALYAQLLMVGSALTTSFLAPSRIPVTHFVQSIFLWCTAAAIAGLHLFHARGVSTRPRAWILSFAILVSLAYFPLYWFPHSWSVTQVFIVASTTLRLRGVTRVAGIVIPLVVGAGIAFRGHRPAGLGQALAAAIEVLVAFSILAACLVGVAVLVRAVEQLHATRCELSERAAGRERLRVSQDLHDLLGQSLSAVSLKGDLAATMLITEPLVAREEIHAIASLSRKTLRMMRQVTLGSHTVSWHDEVAGAHSLLTAGGIRTEVDVTQVDAISAALETTLAWATREAVTNILRHSRASYCNITAYRSGETIHFNVVNDGAPNAQFQNGGGLTGLSERINAVSGTICAYTTLEGQFHLQLTIPLGAE